MPDFRAGSAIAQGRNVGRIDRWEEWKPTTADTLWLLLSGASDPPSSVIYSKRRADRSAFLAGVAHDLANVQDAIEPKLFNTVQDRRLKKTIACEHLKEFFDECVHRKVQPVLYYTGHGEIGTGNWCFKDGTISIQEIVDMLPGGVYYPMIFSDACYSGHWANFCVEKAISGFNCLAACPNYSTAFDTHGEGGDLTLFMTGKKPRPRTEPMYSGGKLIDYPITIGYDSVAYVDLISTSILNSQFILICQSMYDGYLCYCCALTKMYSPRPVVSWGIQKDYDSFLKYVKEQWKWVNGKSRTIYSLACDEKLGFGVFLMENYGAHQVIIMDVYNIQAKWEDGYKITACASRGSTFYIVMTKDTKEYTGKIQACSTCVTWAETESEIQNYYSQGKIITGICYSPGLGQYFVVMTESPEGQTYRWFNDDDSVVDAWLDELATNGFHVTIMFKDPTDSNVLIVVTKDKNRTFSKYGINRKITYK